MTRHYKRYTDISIIYHVKLSKSLAEVLRKLNLKPLGGNFLTLKRNIQRLKLNTNHFTGQAWSKNKVLKDINSYIKPKFKKEALAKKRGKRICNKCKRSTWFGKKIPLEIHHCDKDRTNNDDINLELLCKNCHAIKHNKT